MGSELWCVKLGDWASKLLGHGIGAVLAPNARPDRPHSVEAVLGEGKAVLAEPTLGLHPHLFDSEDASGAASALPGDGRRTRPATSEDGPMCMVQT